MKFYLTVLLITLVDAIKLSNQQKTSADLEGWGFNWGGLTKWCTDAAGWVGD